MSAAVNITIPRESVEIRELHGESTTLSELERIATKPRSDGDAFFGVLVLRLARMSEAVACAISRAKARNQRHRIVLTIVDVTDEAIALALAAGADDVITAAHNDTVFGLRLDLQVRSLIRDIEHQRLTRVLIRRLRKFRDMTLFDPLTGIPNRLAFEHALTREWSRHLRYGRPLAVLFCDIDNFKNYNDSRGHLDGDRALALVGRALVNSLHRDPDLVARYGGEEFTALLCETDIGGAAEVADRMRASVEALRVSHPYNETGFLTISIGVATGVPTTPNDEKALLESADRALYGAKRAGRNVVAVDLGSSDQFRSIRVGSGT